MPDASSGDPSGDPLARVDPWVALADGRAQLMRALEGLDEATAGLAVHERGEWRIADLLTHVAAWDALVADCLGGVAAGLRAFELIAAPDDGWSTWNRARVAEALHDPLEARITRLHDARAALLDASYALDRTALDQRIAAPWGLEDTVRAFLVAQAMHDGEHADVIAAARARAG